MYVHKILVTGFFFLLTFMLQAQPNDKGSISGKVTDLLGNPVAGVSVFVSDLGVVSDEQGHFAIKDLAAGKIKLHVSAIGFVPQSHDLNIQKEKNITFNVTLEDLTTQLDNVVVEGKSDNEMKIDEIKTSGFSANVIDLKLYNNMTTDVNQVLKRTTGVLIRESGGMGSAFTFRINGLPGKIYIDDVPMDQYGSSMTLNNFPVNLIDRVEVYKGVVPSHLGSDAMGGAVNIITKQRTRKFLDISQSYGSFNTHQTAITGGIRDKKTGLKLRASAYYNYSDNNYMMYSNPEYNVLLNVVVKADSNQFRAVTIDRARRFHDRYWSAMGEIEAGFEKVKWADWLTVGLTYSQNMKQIQNGATVNTVRGGYWTENQYIMPAIKFRKENFLIKGLHANLYVNYSKSKDNNRDTARYDYDWSGKWVASAGGDRSEEISTELMDDSFAGRGNFNYELDEDLNHSLNLNYTFSTTRRRTYDMMELNPAKMETSGLPKKLGKHVIGFSWQGQWFSKKLISVFSVKYYGMDTRAILDERPRDETQKPIGDEFVSRKKVFGYPSAVIALRYLITPDFGIKTSLERGYALPETNALYGDGQNVLANYELKPERSDNLNLGGYYNHFFGDHFINLDASAFHRNSRDYIISQPLLNDPSKSQSTNLPGVRSYGFEGEAKYGYKDFIFLSVNGTYNKEIDSWKYTDSTNSIISLSYKHQLPNRPWIYTNVNLTLAKRDLLGKDTRLQLSYLYQFTHWFYMQWGHLGSAASLNFVPSQTTQTTIITYSWKKDRYNISFEARNITDERAYDNFRLQKPGRSFYVKFRISLL